MLNQPDANNISNNKIGYIAFNIETKQSSVIKPKDLNQTEVYTEPFMTDSVILTLPYAESYTRRMNSHSIQTRIKASEELLISQAQLSLEVIIAIKLLCRHKSVNINIREGISVKDIKVQDKGHYSIINLRGTQTSSMFIRVKQTNDSLLANVFNDYSDANFVYGINCTPCHIYYDGYRLVTAFTDAKYTRTVNVNYNQQTRALYTFENEPITSEPMSSIVSVELPKRFKI